MGSRLKANKKILKNTPYQKMFTIYCWLVICILTVIKNPIKKIKASSRFDSGPANETTASLYEDQRKLKTPLVGTVIRVELT